MPNWTTLFSMHAYVCTCIYMQVFAHFIKCEYYDILSDDETDADDEIMHI